MEHPERQEGCGRIGGGKPESVSHRIPSLNLYRNLPHNRILALWSLSRISPFESPSEIIRFVTGRARFRRMGSRMAVSAVSADAAILRARTPILRKNGAELRTWTDRLSVFGAGPSARPTMRRIRAYRLERRTDRPSYDASYDETDTRCIADVGRTGVRLGHPTSHPTSSTPHPSLHNRFKHRISLVKIPASLLPSPLEFSCPLLSSVRLPLIL
jgi:hypothetical protein